MSDIPVTGLPLDDITAEGPRLVLRLAERGLVARLVGGVGVAAHRHGDSPAALDRGYGDLDVVVPAGSSKRLASALDELGYQGNRRFNALHGDRRMMFHDRRLGRQLDVLVGVFAMCHTLELSDRLGTGGVALTPADLLLTKLQVVEINGKDLLDAVSLLHHHELAERADLDADVLDLGRLAEVCGQSWGWHATVTDNLPRVTDAAAELLADAPADAVADQVERITARLADCPKSLRWRARARVGRRVAWYELPEEVATDVGGAARG
ncbi:MAG TPA: hypothetical protein VH008_06405 [Pseudonocardia sp.]|jgi:hypothetical protein|nr:hypothetical protein [Pseudonocardia sp.]